MKKERSPFIACEITSSVNCATRGVEDERESLGALTDSRVCGGDYLTPEDRPRKPDRVENEWPSAVTKRLVSHSRKCPLARNVGRCTIRRWLTFHEENSEYTRILSFRLLLSLPLPSISFLCSVWRPRYVWPYLGPFIIGQIDKRPPSLPPPS